MSNYATLNFNQSIAAAIAICERIYAIDGLIQKYSGSETMVDYCEFQRDRIKELDDVLDALNLAHMLPIYKRNMKGDTE